jgi:putative PIN family toxin of toxin-antitoxin system
MSRKAIVLNTNVLISAVLSPNGTARKAFDEAIANYRMIQSGVTYEELVSRLQKKKFDKYVSVEDRIDFLAMIRRYSEFISVKAEITLCSDPDDNKFLDLAIAEKAEYLITGDQDLLVIGNLDSTKIVRPAEFLTLT